MGEGTMNRPFSSTLQRYSPANISATSPSRHQWAPRPLPDPLLQIRTYESPFFPKLEGGDLMVLKITVECPLGNLQVTARLFRRHQFALGLFDHGVTVGRYP